MTADISRLKEGEGKEIVDQSLFDNPIASKAERISLSLIPQENDSYPLPLSSFVVGGAVEGKFSTLVVNTSLKFSGYMKTKENGIVRYKGDGMSVYAPLKNLILFTDGVGWTGATCGIVLASVTFSASGQHPGNVWPVLTGYVGLYALIKGLSIALGIPMVWSLSTQAYMNGAAFATGLCPFTGKYGKRYGFLAGFVSATLATATLSIHGGFMLYNGGLVAGMAALILTPLLKGIKERADETEEEEEM